MKASTVKIPTIRLSSASSESEEDVQQTVDTLRQACETVGFFYLQVDDDDNDDIHDINERLDSTKVTKESNIQSLLKAVFHQSQQFFDLPTNVKQHFSDPILNRGYTAMEEEWLDPSHQSKGDTKEGYYIGQERVEYEPKKLCGPNVWPVSVSTCESASMSESASTSSLLQTSTEFQSFNGQEWKRIMSLYFSRLSTIGFRVVQLIALAIGLPSQHYFDDDFADPVAMLRLLHYSNQVSDPGEGVYGCGRHSDYGMITILATDMNPGLQILLQTKDKGGDKNGDGEEAWMDVPPPPPGTFIVNLGDMLERWTNGRFKSTVHRVINHKGVERYSIPFFYDPTFDTVVECLDVCRQGEDGSLVPSKYPVTTSGQHLLDKYKETHADFHASD